MRIIRAVLECGLVREVLETFEVGDRVLCQHGRCRIVAFKEPRDG